MAKLFEQIPEENRKGSPYPLRLTTKEKETIAASAKMRNLSMAEFIRRAALGRRADVRYETEIVLMLREVVKAIKALHKAVVDRGLIPPEDEWRPVIKQAVAAMLRINK